MKPTLGHHEIMIVYNTVHDDPCARVPQNKAAFSARGWNPMNRTVIYLPRVIGEIRNGEMHNKKWSIENL